ncbi:MAG: hypothetical protein AB3N16_07755 [Flavobacteriaceae bacterium]
MANTRPPTPLYKKLGITDHSEILVLNPPKRYTDFFMDFPAHVVIHETGDHQEVGFIHIFVSTMEELEHFYAVAKTSLARHGTLWISWPKKASGIKTELDKFTIMAYGVKNGLVDTKVAAIDKNWSGHKFVYRVKDR